MQRRRFDVYVFFLAGLMWGPVHARAQDLDAWLDAIDEVNPSVMAARAKWQAAQAMSRQVYGLPDPMVGVEMMRDDSTRFSDYSELEYMLEQEIPWLGRRGVDRDVARLEAEAMGYEMLEVRRQVRARLVAATWELWAARRSLDIVHAQVPLTESLAEVTRSRLEAGQAAQADWLRLQVEVARLRNEAITMERDTEVALARLNTLLNAEPMTPRATDRMPARPEWNLSLEQIQQDARQYCCILMATLWREMAREAARKSARLEQRPNVSVYVKARQFRDTGAIEEYDTGVALNVPWLWRGKYEGRRAGAEADYQMAQAELEEETAMTLLEIQEMYTGAEARLRAVRLYEEKILPQTRALAESSREAYPAGMMPAMELLDAQRMVLDAEMTYARETAAYAAAHAKLMAIARPWTPDEFQFGLPLHEVTK